MDGVQNKRLNEQVKRKIERFPDDFMFQLTKEEWNTLRSQFATTKDLSKIREHVNAGCTKRITACTVYACVRSSNLLPRRH